MFNAFDKPFLDYTQEKNKNTRVKIEEIISCSFSNIYLQDLVEADKML